LIYRRRAAEQGFDRWGVQMGDLESKADRILGGLPGSRVLHLIRHPSRHLSEHAGGNGALRTNMELSRWRESARLGVSLSSLHPDRYRVIRTEQLAADPSAAVQAACEFLELEHGSPVSEAIQQTDWAQLLTEAPDVPLDRASAQAAIRLGFDFSTKFTSRLGDLSGRIAWSIAKQRGRRAWA
jgi:hypothetical protein